MNDFILLGSMTTGGILLEAYFCDGKVFYRALKSSTGQEARFRAAGSRLITVINSFEENSADWYKVLYLLEQNKRTLVRKNLSTVSRELILNPMENLVRVSKMALDDTVKGVKEIMKIYKNL